MRSSATDPAATSAGRAIAIREAVRGAMGKATRVEHRWCDDDGDGSFLTVIYRIEGYEKRLWTRAFWSMPITSEEQRREIEPCMLRLADEEADWCAEHPEDVPTAEWAFT